MRQGPLAVGISAAGQRRSAALVRPLVPAVLTHGDLAEPVRKPGIALQELLARRFQIHVSHGRAL